MRSDLLDYDLPSELIAQKPLESRDQSRLFQIERGTENFSHHVFAEIGKFLREGDVLVLNNSKVIPARLSAVNDAGRDFEILLLEQKTSELWEVLIKPGKKLKSGDRLVINDDPKKILFIAQLEDKLPDGTYLLRFNLKGQEFRTALEKFGEVPLPPYITESKSHKDQYQTVYADAQKEGSAAAPTAGFHFTPELLESIEKQGIQIEYVTLYVGLGTFQPIRTENIEDHQIHSERFEVDPETAARISKAKQEGRRIIAVGTTAARVLETLGNWPEFKDINEVLDTDDPKSIPGLQGATEIYIYPGYTWKIVDGLITNFHLPRTSLIALVASFVSDPTRPNEGLEIIQKAYAEAVKQKYRFYSFGDAMLII